MHAPVMIEMPLNNDHKIKNVKPNPSERVLRARQSQLSKTESSGSSSDTPSNDECESCGNIGNLVTCDGCYGTFHSECFNPSSQEESDELYCFDCTATMNCAQGISSPSSGHEAIEEPSCPSPKAKKLKASSEKASSPSKKKRKQPTKVCEVCDQFGELISCIICEKTFHTYCVDLIHPTPHFKCSDHEDVELIPREMFPLHFTPEQWRSEASIIHIEDDKDSTLENTNKRFRTDESQDEDIPNILLMLKDAKSSEISPSILKNFSPKFIEFLAWQQLRQIQQGILDKRNGKL